MTDDALVWWRSHISRRWVRRLSVKDLSGLIHPMNDQTLGGKWLHFVGRPAGRFMITSPDLFSEGRVQLLQLAHTQIIGSTVNADDYISKLKVALLTLSNF